MTFEGDGFVDRVNATERPGFSRLTVRRWCENGRSTTARSKSMDGRRQNSRLDDSDRQARACPSRLGRRSLEGGEEERQRPERAALARPASAERHSPHGAMASGENDGSLVRAESPKAQAPLLEAPVHVLQAEGRTFGAASGARAGETYSVTCRLTAFGPLPRRSGSVS